MARQTQVPDRSEEFAGFMRAYQDMVFSTAARITGNDAQAQDIAQEVFLAAFENYEQLRTSPTMGGWLKKVATNLTLNYVSRYRKRWRFFSEMRTEEEEDYEPGIEFATPDTLVAGIDAHERSAIVERTLKSLPDHQRIPLVLYHFEEMPYEDIAKQLGVSLAKVKTDIHRGRAALAKALGGHGLENIA